MTDLLPRAAVEDALRRRGAVATVDDFLEVLDEVSGSAATLSAGERDFLARVGVSGDLLTAESVRRARMELAAMARLAARRADVGLTTCDVAELLKTQPANVRRLLAVGALYAAGRAARAEHVFPAWQFVQPRPLPHLSEVLAALPPATHPLEVEAFMTSPREALGGRSPVEWLSTGGDAAVVVDLADEENWV